MMMSSRTLEQMSLERLVMCICSSPFLKFHHTVLLSRVYIIMRTSSTFKPLLTAASILSATLHRIPVWAAFSPCYHFSSQKNVKCCTEKNNPARNHALHLGKKDSFASGAELSNTRNKISLLKDDLKRALEADDIYRAIRIRESIRHEEKKDPELAYTRALRRIEKAHRSNRISKYEIIEKYTERALLARKYITRYNLNGLWLGTFGDNGKGLINITYSGDTLIAKKVTGDKHVPRGEVTFRADLKPPELLHNHSSYDCSLYDLQTHSPSSSLRPIELTGSIGSRWGTTKLERFSGWGQIASVGHKNATFVPGQIIIFPSAKNVVEPTHFSFLWLPTKHHIVFSRPTFDEITTLTRDVLSIEDENSNIKEYIQQCFQLDMTVPSSLQAQGEYMDDREIESDTSNVALKNPFRRIPLVSDLALITEHGGLHNSTFHALELKDKLPSFSVISFWAAKKFRSLLDSFSDRSGKHNSDSP